MSLNAVKMPDVNLQLNRYLGVFADRFVDDMLTIVQTPGFRCCSRRQEQVKSAERRLAFAALPSTHCNRETVAMHPHFVAKTVARSSPNSTEFDLWRSR